MPISFLKSFFSPSHRSMKKLNALVSQINTLEAAMQQLTSAELRQQTMAFQEHLAQDGAMDDLIPDAFATVREASVRTLGLRHFDEQLIGGLILQFGGIAEMKTGEGKTLAAVLPAYLHSLDGEPVHIMTANDFLAQRDAQWMAPLYESLGVSVSYITSTMSESDRRVACLADVVYGSSAVFGFDYLSDNLKPSIDQMVQRGQHFAIIDEADSLLIDEARTPLVVSSTQQSDLRIYHQSDQIARHLKEKTTDSGDYIRDPVLRNITLTDEGVTTIEKLARIDNLYDPQHINLLHHIMQALRANFLLTRDIDYVVTQGRVHILDEHNGRIMEGKRWSNGLHQAVEIKEQVQVEDDIQILASMAHQNFFLSYQKLSGMTGTAMTEAFELQSVYGLDVFEVPTHLPTVRVDHPDVVFRTKSEKFNAMVKDICACHRKGQPVLVGTVTVAQSKELSGHLQNVGVQHNVLNAINHKSEAEIIAQAGKLGAVTISTNMAGRGTDIVLGGLLGSQDDREKVVKAGGLFVMSLERHESRRLDDQLRGRAGRQGDPGESRFYLSLEDDLMQKVESGPLAKVMNTLNVPEGQPLEHKIIDFAIASAQKTVEEHNRSIRRALVEYDDIMHKQRKVIYASRKAILSGGDLRDWYEDSIHGALSRMVSGCWTDNGPDRKALNNSFFSIFGSEPHLDPVPTGEGADVGIQGVLFRQGCNLLDKKLKELAGAEVTAALTQILLDTVDSGWKKQIQYAEYLKQSIGLRQYAQKNPRTEFRNETHRMFMEMMSTFQEDALKRLFHSVVKKAA